MSGLALLPLETHSLPGWPVPPQATGLDFLVVLVAIPALITLLIVLLVTARAMRLSNRVTSEGVLDAPPEHGPALGSGGATAVESGTQATAALPASSEESAETESERATVAEAVPRHGR